MSKISVLFVCTENICRSPMAQGLLEHKLRQAKLHRLVQVESAGVCASQPGHRPDIRVQKVARANGVKLRRIKARRIKAEDFSRFDYILAMDAEHCAELEDICPPEHRHKVGLVMNYAPQTEMREVPDPYYGSLEGFNRVFNLLDLALDGLMNQLFSSRVSL